MGRRSVVAVSEAVRWASRTRPLTPSTAVPEQQEELGLECLELRPTQSNLPPEVNNRKGK